jgi:tetratricopeptide (TPR) repeat protein
MERMEEWHHILHSQLEQLASQVRALTSPAIGGEITLPSLDQDMKKVEQGLFSIFQKIERSLRSIMKLLFDPTTMPPGIKIPELIQALTNMAVVASSVLVDSGRAIKLMSQGETLQGVLELSDDTIQSLYALTGYLYEQQHYEEASGVFFLLSLLNPSCYEFWVGLGNCEYILGRYVEALLPYSMALEVRHDDALVHILNARCHIALGNHAVARACLMMAENAPVDVGRTETIQRQKDAVYDELKRFL